MEANFRALVVDRGFSSGLQDFYPLLEHQIQSSYRGTLERDYDLAGSGPWVLKPTNKRLGEDEWKALSALYSAATIHRWIILAGISHRGRAYAPHECTSSLPRVKDSFVQYQSPSGPAFGRIRRLLASKDVGHVTGDPRDIILIIHPFKTLSAADSANDPYSRFPHIGCRMVYDKVESRFDTVTAAAILAPVAVYEYGNGDEQHRMSRDCLALLPV